MFKKILRTIKDFSQPNKLNQVIFFVTSRCNSCCRHCFYWRNLNRPDDLKLEEIEKISSSLPHFSDLLLSGGEPFLRDDLVEIVKIFRKNNKIKTINVPTNGLLKEKILADTLKISGIDPRLAVYINLSLDGPATIHDYIRGIPGSFERAIDLLKSLYKMSEEKSNVFIAIETVANFYNLEYLGELMDYIEKLNLPKILHYFEILRGEPRETEFAKKISLKDYQNLYQKILDYQTKRFANFYKGQIGAFLKTKLARAHLKLFYKIQADSYFNIRNWPMNCVAGKNMFVIDYNGDLRACELRGKVVNAKERNFDLSDWRGVFENERKNIKKEKCSCTHSCFLYQSIHYSPKVIFLSFLPLFIRSLFIRK